MKGFLIKDFKLLFGQKKFFIVVVFFGVFFLFSDMDVFFAISYMTFVFSIFTISTISYDDFDNGMAFLMTLPPSRRMYVREKYLFGLINAGAAWIFSLMLVSLFSFGKGVVPDFPALIAGALPMLGIVFVFLAIMIPIQFKFGAEKSRIVMIVIVGGCMLVGYLLGSLLKYLQFDVDAAVEYFLTVNEALIILILVALALLIIGTAYKAAVRIMEHKQL